MQEKPRPITCCLDESEFPMRRDEKNEGGDQHSDLGMVTLRHYHPDRTPGSIIVHFIR